MNSGHDEYLRAILESAVFYNVESRASIARSLRRAYHAAIADSDEKLAKSLAVEIFVKLLQVVEDAALFGLMFTHDSKAPERVFQNYSNTEIREFLFRARTGLPDEDLLKIIGAFPVKMLLREKLILKEEADYYRLTLAEAVDALRENYRRLGEFYADEHTKGSGNTVSSYSLITNAYFNLKHGFKVFWPTPTAERIWGPDRDKVLILTGLPKDTDLRVAALDWDESMIDTLIERIVEFSFDLKGFANIHLQLLDNPAYLVELIREGRAEDLRDTLKPKVVGRNDPCPCGSKKKYKKCCGA